MGVSLRSRSTNEERVLGARIAGGARVFESAWGHQNVHVHVVEVKTYTSVSSRAKLASLSWLLAHAPTAAVAGLSGHLKARDGRDGRREAGGVDARLVRCEEPNSLHVRAHAHHAAAQPLGGHCHGARVLLDADDERVEGVAPEYTRVSTPESGRECGVVRCIRSF